GFIGGSKRWNWSTDGGLAGIVADMTRYISSRCHAYNDVFEPLTWSHVNNRSLGPKRLLTVLLTRVAVRRYGNPIPSRLDILNDKPALRVSGHRSWPCARGEGSHHGCG